MTITRSTEHPLSHTLSILYPRFGNTLHDEVWWRQNSGLLMKCIWVACLCHTDRDHMVKYLQGISALRPMSFISGNFRLCRVGLRKFQILYHFTFGDLEFRATRFILIPRSPCQSLHCSTLNWLHGDLLEDREHSWGFWSHIWKKRW